MIDSENGSSGQYESNRSLISSTSCSNSSSSSSSSLSSSSSSSAEQIPKVFISYPHADSQNPLLIKLIQNLDQNDLLDSWLDRQEIQIGESLIQRISEGIRAADYFLFVLSKNSEHSRWAKQELQYAISSQFERQRTSLIIVKIDDISVPPPLENFSYIDLWKDYESGFTRILERVLKQESPRIVSFDIDRTVDQTSILQVADNVNARLIRYFADHPHELKIMDRRLFEQMVAELFDGFGFEVELTKQTRDGGRDVIAVTHGIVSAKYLIECKRPDPGGHVGVSAVRELYGVKVHEGATKGILATTAYFSKDALLLFDDHKWELEPTDYDGLLKWISEYLAVKSH